LPHEVTVTDFEQSLICAAEAFYRCIGLLLGPAAREHRLSGQDNVILQQLMASPHPRSVTDLARFANRDDIPNIQYSLRKLIAARLVEKAPGSTNRDSRYQVTGAGKALTEEFLARRRALVMNPSDEMREADAHLQAAIRALDMMTGVYDRGTRSMSAREDR
jgi:predicted MarR family transcription regulator